MAKVYIRLLGPFEVYLDGERVRASQFGSRKARDVLRWLADARGTVVTDHLLSHSLWPDVPPERAIRSLRVRVSELRKFFSKMDAKVTLLERSVDGYTLRTEPGYLAVDADEFQTLAEKVSEEQSPEKALPLLTQCLALYKGDYMADDSNGIQWHDSRTRYRTIFLNISGQLATVYEQLRRYDEGIQLLQNTLRQHKGQEGLFRQLIRLQYLNGDQSGALRTYQECRDYLDRELGVTPMPETMRLLQKVLRHEPILENDDNRRSHKVTYARPITKSGVTWPFLGRTREMSVMQKKIEELNNGQGGVVWLHGRSGIGKTRFLREFLRLHTRGAPLRSIWIQGSKLNARIPFAGILDALQMNVSPILSQSDREKIMNPPLPHVQKLVRWGHMGGAAKGDHDRDEDTTDNVWLRQELIELFLRLTRDAPLICCIDDAHTLDSASQSLLLALAKRTEKKSILLAFTSRSSLTNQGLGRELSQTSVPLDEMVLKPLNINALRSLIGRGIPAVWAQRWLQQLYKNTGGEPFMLVRALHELRKKKLLGVAHGQVVFPQGILSLMTESAILQSSSDKHSVHDGQTQTVGHHLDKVTYTVLCKAAVLGDSLTLDRLQQLVDEPPNVFQKTLDTLIQHAYFEFNHSSPQADMAIAFSHHRVWQQIYHNISEAERIWYHRGVCELLRAELEQHQGDITEVEKTRLLSEIAFHALRCAKWHDAARWSLRAAKAAEAITPGAEVVLLCRQAYDAAQRAAHYPELIVETRFALAEALFLMGLYNDAMPLYKQLDRDDHLKQELIQRRLVSTYLDLNRLDEALEIAKKLVSMSGSDNEVRGLALQTLMNVYYRRGNVSAAIDNGKKAIQLLQDEKYSEARGDVYYSLCLVFWDLGEYGEALSYAKKSLDIRRRIQSTKLMNSLNVVGELYQDLFCVDLALQYHREALKLAIQEGRLAMSIEVWRNLGLNFVFEGRLKKGLDALLRTWQQVEDLNLGVYRQELHLRTLLEASLLAHDVAAAKRYLARYEKVTGLREHSFVTIFSAAIALLENSFSEGEDVLQGVLKFWEETGRRGRAMHVLLFVGETLMLQGNNTMAKKYLLLAYEEMQRIMDIVPPEVVQSLQSSQQYKAVKQLINLT